MSSMGGVIQDIWPRLTYIGYKPVAIMKTDTYTGCCLMEQRTANHISLGTKLGLFWGVTTTITITSLHKALQVCDKSLTVTTPACIQGYSRGSHICRPSRRSRTSFLEAVTYVISRWDHVRRLSRWSRTSSLVAVTHVISRVKLAPKTWLRDGGYICTVRA